MFVFGKFVRETSISLGKYWSFSGGFGSGKFNSKDFNSGKSIFVFFKLLDEELVGFTSGDVKLDKFGSDGIESVGNPFEMIVGVLDFTFNPFSVSSSVFSNFSVSIGYSGKVVNGFGTINLLLCPTLIMFFLFFIDRIFKFGKKLLNSVNCVRSHGVGKHHVIYFRIEGCCLSTNKDKCD